MTRRSISLSALVLLLLAGAARPALAVARHERVSITAIKQRGKAVGFELKLTLRPESYQRVRIGLGQTKATGSPSTDQKRRLAAGVNSGYLRLKLGEHNNLASTNAKEVVYRVTYGKGNSLKPGEKVDLITAWNRASNASYWHVFGMADGPVTRGQTYTLPK